MELPLILINFKAYREGTGKNAVKLAKICDEVAKKYKLNIAIAPQYIDIREIKSKVSVPIFAQHIDPVETAGAYTGHVVAENLKEWISGTLINHSEKRISKEDIAKCIKISKNFGLISVCCASTPKEAGEISMLAPDFIAIEPPELIGSGVSVSTARPEVVAQSIDKVRKTNPRIKVICGAGITNGEDVRKALQLGTVGVILSSGFVKSNNPEKVLIEFAEAVKGEER